MNPGKLNKRIEVWSEIPFENESLEADTKEQLVKKVYSSIIPMTGSLKNQAANTVVSGTTHKIIIRYITGKFIKDSMWFMFKGTRYDIKFILNPFEANKKLEFFCEVVND